MVGKTKKRSGKHAQGKNALEIAEWKNECPIEKWRANYNEINGGSMSQALLASRLGVNRITLINWFNGQPPGERSFDRIAALLGVTVKVAQGRWERWLAKRPEG